MDTHQLAYLAGFFDGEGYIGVVPGGCPRVFIEITQINPEILHRFHQEWGGTLTYRDRGGDVHRPHWSYRASSRQAEGCLRALLPYLCGKYNETVAALAIRDAISTGRRGRAVTAEMAQSRQQAVEAYEQVKQVARTSVFAPQ